jgi:hypothetical protein
MIKNERLIKLEREHNFCDEILILNLYQDEYSRKKLCGYQRGEIFDY